MNTFRVDMELEPDSPYEGIQPKAAGEALQLAKSESSPLSVVEMLESLVLIFRLWY